MTSTDEQTEELREALDALREEIRARMPGAKAEGTSPAIDLAPLFNELRRRLGKLGMSERSGNIDEFGMDEAALQRARPLLDFLFDSWWRVDVHGIEQLPEKGPVLFVANRSGMLPWDGLMVAQAVERHCGERPRFFAADWLVTLPFVQPFLARLGGVRACRENAERLLASGRSVAVFPEGAKGATKVFRERYRLKRFGRGGVVRVALELGVPLVPVGIVGAEEVHPILFKWTTPARAVGLPFLPVTPTFPWLGPLGALPLPAKWVVRFGEPIAMDHLDADAATDELLISRLTEDTRQRIQTLVDVGLADRESVWS